MASKLPESTRSTYARQLADEAKTLVPGVERLGEIVAELRADDLYQTLGFDTWERFCADYIGVTKRTANRWIGTWKQTAIPARSTEQTKSIGAGQSVAAGQNVPVVESDTLKSDKSPEGLDQRDHIGSALPTEPSGAVSANDPPTPSGPSSAEGGSDGLAASTSGSPASATGHPSPAGPSSRGARATAPPPRRDAPTEVPPASRPAPPDPSSAGGKALGEVSPTPAAVRPPTDRALTARVFAAMRDIDPTDAGPVTTPEEVTFLRQWAQRTLDAWKAVHAPPAPAEKPQRRQSGVPSRSLARMPAQVHVTGRGKRHADDCSCLSCKAPKAVAK